MFSAVPDILALRSEPLIAVARSHSGPGRVFAKSPFFHSRDLSRVSGRFNCEDAKIDAFNNLVMTSCVAVLAIVRQVWPHHHLNLCSSLVFVIPVEGCCPLVWEKGLRKKEEERRKATLV